jgi:hypothetical protein
LKGNAQNPSTIIALKLAGFKTREQQKNFLSVVLSFDLTADFKDGKLSMRIITNVALEANAQWKELQIFR